MENVRLLTVAGESALAELERLRAEFPRTGEYPILLGDREEADGIEENQEFGLEDDPDGSKALAASEEIDAASWLRRDPMTDEDDPGPDLDDLVGEWPDTPPAQMDITVHRDVLTNKLLPEVVIGLIRVSKPFEIFPKLGWGGWNDCPEPAVHAAVHRYWGERYGAEVVAVSNAVVQCVVARPPSDRASAMILAREQYAYCADIVVQGTDTLANLAASLIDAKYWYFWWD